MPKEITENWKCSSCGSIYGALTTAEFCCLQPKPVPRFSTKSDTSERFYADAEERCAGCSRHIPQGFEVTLAHGRTYCFKGRGVICHRELMRPDMNIYHTLEKINNYSVIREQENREIRRALPLLLMELGANPR